LGLSSSAERAQLESEYFEDEVAFQEILTAEDDLIDAYVRGELGEEERRRFEDSFASSSRGRDRVRFARALTGAISATRSVEIKDPYTLLDVFKIGRFPSLLRMATIAVAIVFVALLAWLVVDYRRMTNQLRKLHIESADLSKPTQALPQSSDTEHPHTADIAAQLKALRPRPAKSSRPGGATTPTRRPRPLTEVQNEPEKIANSKPEPIELVVHKEDSSLGSTFVNKMLTQLPLQGRTVLNLLTLPSAPARDGYEAGSRADQTTITLDGVEVAPFNTYSLIPRNPSSHGKTSIGISNSLSWIRFEIALETVAVHEDYAITIKTADGGFVTSVSWTEPLTPNQTIIATPVISTGALSSGDYVLLLMGKEPDGSLVKVAECPFEVIKY